MGVRNRVYQPTTKNVGDLVIGLLKMGIATTENVNDPANLSGGYSTAMKTLGALGNASLSMKPTFKEHKSGYPQILDFKIAEMLSATYKADCQELTNANVLGLLDNALDTLETGTPHYVAMEALGEYANGGTLSFFSNYAQIKPTLNMNFGDDFSAIPFEFEALANPSYSYQDLIYRKRVTAASRALANQPITTDVDNLGIGMFQVRIGKPARRNSGTASVTGCQLRKRGTGTIATLPVGTVSGTYTGTMDGAFVLTCTEDNTDTTGLNFSCVLPDGSTNAVVFTATNTPVLLGLGVSLAFDTIGSANFNVNDVYVIGAWSASAQDNNITGIISPYSFLTSADRVGAISSASLATNPTFKEHFSGYPKVRDMLMLESSTVDVSTALEEISAATTALTKGYASTPWDMLFDASVNGSLYYVPVEIVMNLATGGVLSFWLPNCQIIPEADFTPGNDWANMPFKLEAQIQGAGSTVKRIYRMTEVPAV